MLKLLISAMKSWTYDCGSAQEGLQHEAQQLLSMITAQCYTAHPLLAQHAEDSADRINPAMGQHLGGSV